jgi:Tol biopolymer transport system component
MRQFILLILLIVSLGIASAQEATEETVLGGGSGEILFVDWDNDSWVVTIMDVNGKVLRTMPEMGNRASHMRWSPDGSEIVFIRQGTSGQEIFVINADGSDLRQLTDNNTRELIPVWSVDASEIIFSSTRAGNIQLFVMSAADGGNVRQLTFDTASYHATDIHPDGEWLAATKIVGQNSEVVLINLLTGEEIGFTDWDSTDGGGRWSPDGTQFVWYATWAGYSELFIVNFELAIKVLPLGADSEEIRQLTFPENGWVGHSFFSWSPDGQYLAVDVLSDNEEPFGTSAEPNLEQNIHRINVETGEVTILTTNDHSAIPEWRP